jgi:uncharacterized protein (TIGR03546 family)
MTQLFKLLKALNANKRPAELAVGMAFGFWLMLVPTPTLVWFFIFMLFFVVKVNAAAGFMVMILAQPLLGILDPLLDNLGFTLLTDPGFETFQVFAATVPLAALWGLEQTLVTGGLIVGALVFIPVSLVFWAVVILYRRFLQPLIFRNKFVTWVLNLPIVQRLTSWYTRVTQVLG